VAGVARPAPVSLGEAFWVWLRIAALSFGGPAGQIAVMHRILVDEKRWIGEHRFLHALNYCMLLPGPEAQQLATYIGWLMHKTRGGIVAGALFVLPGAISIMALSWIYALYGRVGIVSALFFGLKCAVLAVVLQAVVRIGSRALKNNVMRGLAAAAFILIFFMGVPFPIIVLGAGLIGYFGGRGGVPAFQVGGGHGAAKGDIVADADTLLGEELPAHASPTIGQSLRQAAIWLVLWLAPVVALVLIAGQGNVFTQIATFFSTMAVVTLGGLLATWVTFVPCFLWIFLGAPFIERMRGNKALSGALSAITAAVVGVVLNLAIWFAIHTIFHVVQPLKWGPIHFDMPVPSSIDLWALAISIAAIVAMFRLKVGIFITLGGASAAGVGLYAAGILS
jgi:chromate transport protein ChrA